MTPRISVLDLFTIGIGPSSSHTVGPMRAALRFTTALAELGLLTAVSRVEAHLYGSLALTGKGHGSDVAVLLGLEAQTPEQVDVDNVPARVARIRESLQLQLHGVRPVPFSERNDLLFHRTESLPEHPNGLRFIALDSTGTELLRKTYFSVGGGFVVGADRAMSEPRPDLDPVGAQRPPFPYESGDDLLAFAAASGLSMSEMTLRNEACWRPEPATRAALLAVWNAMQACVTRGCQHEGVLPGGL